MNVLDLSCVPSKIRGAFPLSFPPEEGVDELPGVAMGTAGTMGIDGVITGADALIGSLAMIATFWGSYVSGKVVVPTLEYFNKAVVVGEVECQASHGVWGAGYWDLRRRSCVPCWDGEVGWQWWGVEAGRRWLACTNGLQCPGFACHVGAAGQVGGGSVLQAMSGQHVGAGTNGIDMRARGDSSGLQRSG
ncbi:hypothetical protein EDB83DRAFT_2316818 [Lactarius deliciosus]|nr:hypothetical protein EDB83DRAFT_2316818 [Lactarius deliciosus]